MFFKSDNKPVVSAASGIYTLQFMIFRCSRCLDAVVVLLKLIALYFNSNFKQTADQCRYWTKHTIKICMYCFFIYASVKIYRLLALIVRTFESTHISKTLKEVKEACGLAEYVKSGSRSTDAGPVVSQELVLSSQMLIQIRAEAEIHTQLSLNSVPSGIISSICFDPVMPPIASLRMMQVLHHKYHMRLM